MPLKNQSLVHCYRRALTMIPPSELSLGLYVSYSYQGWSPSFCCGAQGHKHSFCLSNHQWTQGKLQYWSYHQQPWHAWSHQVRAQEVWRNCSASHEHEINPKGNEHTSYHKERTQSWRIYYPQGTRLVFVLQPCSQNEICPHIPFLLVGTELSVDCTLLFSSHLSL